MNYNNYKIIQYFLLLPVAFLGPFWECLPIMFNKRESILFFMFVSCQNFMATSLHTIRCLLASE